jgi:hypothetical protein
MVNGWFAVHDGLVSAARFPSRVRNGQRISAGELLLLLTCGAAAAAAVAYVKLSLRIPGHSIVLATLPMVLGLSLAPRHLAGSVMSIGAVGTAWLLSATGGASYGSGSFVSLSLIGPMMDVAVRHARGGWRVYVALVLSGVATNLLALGSRGAFKVLGLDEAGARPFDGWWLQAAVTYTLSGLFAGLLGALCWFHFNDRRARGPQA